MDLYQHLKLQRVKKVAQAALLYAYIKGIDSATITTYLDEIEGKEISINKSRSLIISPTLNTTAKEMHRRVIAKNEELINMLRMKLADYIEKNLPQFANDLKI